MFPKLDNTTNFARRTCERVGCTQKRERLSSVCSIKMGVAKAHESVFQTGDYR